MKKVQTGVIAALVIIIAIVLIAQKSNDGVKAPYLTDADAAMAQAADSGMFALIYFYSPT